MSIMTRLYTSLNANSLRFLSSLSQFLQASSCNVSVSEDGKKLKLLCDGEQERRYHGVWLRHNCRCPECYSSTTNQCQVHPSTLSTDSKVKSACIKDDVLHVKWNSLDHTGFFPLQWLKDNDYSDQESRKRKQLENKPLIAKSLPLSDFNDIMSSDEGTYNWLKQINYYGISVVQNVPQTEEALKKFVSKFPHLQSYYGDIYDVLTHDHIDDLGQGTGHLNFHQDLLYYEAPPGIQVFNCVRNDPCIEGGESILLDLYPIAEELRLKYPDKFRTLTQVPVTFERSIMGKYEEAELRIGRYHIHLDRYDQISAINWNTYHLEPLCVDEDLVEHYYDAFLCFSKMIEESDLKIIYRVSPGETLFFNNRRFVHSRTGFKLNGGVRHFNGFYVHIDYLRSQFQLLAKKLRKNDTSKHIFSSNV